MTTIPIDDTSAVRHGRAVQRKTFCGICEASCGLVATVDDGRLVALRPDAEHPASQGFACSKGVQFGSVVADPDRVTVPLRRTSNGFEPATWTEALDDIGTRLGAIRKRHGTESIGVAWGNPIAWNYAATVTMNGFAAALKTKHHYTSASIDVNNYWAAADMLYGNSTVNPLPDFAATDFALIVGANPVVSHGSLVTTGRIREVLLDIPRRGDASWWSTRVAPKPLDCSSTFPSSRAPMRGCLPRSSGSSSTRICTTWMRWPARPSASTDCAASSNG